MEYSEQVKSAMSEVLTDMGKVIALFDANAPERAGLTELAGELKAHFIDGHEDEVVIPYICETEEGLPPRAMMLTPEQLRDVQVRAMTKALTGQEPDGEVQCEALYVYEKHSGKWMLGTDSAPDDLNAALTVAAQGLGVDLV